MARDSSAGLEDDEAPYVAKIHIHSASHLLAKDLNGESAFFAPSLFLTSKIPGGGGG